MFPNARLVHRCEWYSNADGADLGFHPEFPLSFDDRARIRIWNALHTLNLTNCDAAISPTHWRKSRHLEIFQSKITVQHEGIDTVALGSHRNQPDKIVDLFNVALRSNLKRSHLIAMKQLLLVSLVTALIAAQGTAAADPYGCALDLPDQRFDLPDRDQALAPLRACYTKHIKAAARTMDETALVKTLMNESCVSQTSSLLKEYAGKGALGTTADEDRKTVECWARGVSRWIRKSPATK